MVGDEQRKQMMSQQQRQQTEKEGGQTPIYPNSHAPGSHESQFAVNSPQVVAYHPHAAHMPLQQGRRNGKDIDRCLKESSWVMDLEARVSMAGTGLHGMQPQIIASQAPAPTFRYVRGHPGMSQHPSEQRRFSALLVSPPPQSGQQRFDVFMNNNHRSSRALLSTRQI